MKDDPNQTSQVTCSSFPRPRWISFTEIIAWKRDLARVGRDCDSPTNSRRSRSWSSVDPESIGSVILPIPSTSQMHMPGVGSATGSLAVRKVSAGCLDPYDSGDHHPDPLAGVIHGAGAVGCWNHGSSIHGVEDRADRLQEESLMSCLPLLSSLDPGLVKRSMHCYRKLPARRFPTEPQDHVHHGPLSTDCSIRSIGRMGGPVRGLEMQQEPWLEQDEMRSRRSAEIPQVRNGRPGRSRTRVTGGSFDRSREEVSSVITSTNPTASTANIGEKVFGPLSSHRTRVVSLSKLSPRPTLDSDLRPQERFVGPF